jgi:hypothetical protein
MATFNKYNQFVQDLASGVHQLQTGTSHVLRVALSNTAPSNTHATLSQVTELTTGGGYTAGGISVGTITGSQTGGTFKLTGGTDPVWTGSGGGFTARYAILYNDTPTSPADPLIGWWDYGSSVTIAAGETLTVDLDQVNGILTLA